MSANSHPRYDIYGPIHKGLRRALCSMLDRIGSTRFSDEAQRSTVLRDLHQLLTLVASHLKHEELFVHPSIEQRVKGASSKLAQEHTDHDKEMDALRSLAAQVETANDATRPALVQKLYLTFSEFVAENLAHMAEEELVVQPQVLHANFSDAEIAAIEGKILSDVSPDLMMGMMVFMIPAMNPDERVGLLSMMKQTAPPEAFNAVLQVAARPNLSEADWKDLTQRLSVAA